MKFRGSSRYLLQSNIDSKCQARYVFVYVNRKRLKIGVSQHQLLCVHQRSCSDTKLENRCKFSRFSSCWSTVAVKFFVSQNQSLLTLSEDKPKIRHRKL